MTLDEIEFVKITGMTEEKMKEIQSLISKYIFEDPIPLTIIPDLLKVLISTSVNRMKEDS